jgi:hypothetical protein
MCQCAAAVRGVAAVQALLRLPDDNQCEVQVVKLAGGQYIIQLQMLFSHEWQQSAISSKLALAQALRYINVPGKELRQAVVVNKAVHPGC